MVVVIFGVGGIGKTTLANAVFNGLNLSGYRHCRVQIDQDSNESNLATKQGQILRDLFDEKLTLNDTNQGRQKLSEAFEKASKASQPVFLSEAIEKASQPVFLFIDNALRQPDLEKLLPVQDLSRLPKRSRILLTTRDLSEIPVFRPQDGIRVCSHKVNPLSQQEARKLLCQYALDDPNSSFDSDVDMDGLLEFSGGIPLVLRLVGSELNRRGNTMSACKDIVEYHKEWQRTGLDGGNEDLGERMVDFVYGRLKKPSKEAFLDIVFFFYNWDRSMVSEIVGEEELQDLERAALVTTSTSEGDWRYRRDRRWYWDSGIDLLMKKTVVKVHDIVSARGRKLSEGNRIIDEKSLVDLLSDEQQNETPFDTLEGVQGMQHVEDLIVYIDQLMSKIERGGQEQVNRPNSVASSINSGRALTRNISKRLNWHVGKKCFSSALDRQTRKVMVDVFNQAERIKGVGMALSIIAHLLERAEQVSSNKDRCLDLLRSMSSLLKHMKNLDIHLERPELDDNLRFIVKGTLVCALQMDPSSFYRFICAPVDAADLENLKSQIMNKYQHLQLQALTALLNRVPRDPGPSKGEYAHGAVGIDEAKKNVIKLLDLQEESHMVVVIFGVGGIGKTTLANAVFKGLNLSGYRHCRVQIDQDSNESNLATKQGQILRDLFDKNLTLNDTNQGRQKLSEAFEKAFQPVFLFIDNALRQPDLEKLLPVQGLSRLPKRSRILLTTRDLSEIPVFRPQDGIRVCSHKVNPLSQQEARKLLCQYALDDPNSSFDSDVDMDGLLEVSGGIPLVLRLVGSELNRRGNTMSACKDIVEYHKEWQRTGLDGGKEDLGERMVDFVYGRLKKPSKEAFLDIVFFFYNWDRSMVSEIVGEEELQDLERAALVTTSTSEGDWRYRRDWRWYWDSGIDLLMKKTVVKVHDIVSARGRKLAEGNRIIDEESLVDLLSDEQKLRQTRGIWFSPYGEQLSVEAKHLDSMSRCLRVLSLGERVRLNGRCGRDFEQLRILHISDQNLSQLDISKLTGLRRLEVGLISNAEFTINMPKSLCRLRCYAPWDTSASLHINGHMNSLRELILPNVTLANFDTCTSQLQSLHSLVMFCGKDFASISEILRNLCCLNILVLQSCSNLERLPKNFGNLSSLQILNMTDCSKLENLPESFGNLSSLQVLGMNRCSMLERLPESFVNLSSLQTLKMNECSKLQRLHESFGNLSSMRDLNISNCSLLDRFPETFDQMSCLQTLKMDGLKMMCSLSQFKCLKFLSIRNCKDLKRVHDGIISLTSLTAMKAYGCPELEAKAMDSLVEIKSFMFLEIGESPMLIKRWEEIQQQHRPLIGAALRFDHHNNPYAEIMSVMLFSSASRFLQLDGDGELAEVASSSFMHAGVKVGLLLTECAPSDEARHKLSEVASQEYQIIYVDVDVEGSSWMEEREKRIRKMLMQLPERSRAWISPFHKTNVLFAYLLWRCTDKFSTCVVGTSVVVDEEGRKKLSHSLERIFAEFPQDFSEELDFLSLFYTVDEAWEWMVEE